MGKSISSKPGVHFGPFEVDFRAGELRKQGVKLKLVGQPIEVLAVLLECPGEVVTREELRTKLWPTDTNIDFDHGLNAAVNKLREALSDSAEEPKYVETLPRRGYRFIAPVDGCSTPSGIGVAAAPERRKSSFLRHRVAISFLSAIVIAVLVWALRWHPIRRTEIIERRLTANSSENSVSSAAISPDSKYLAYADTTGIFLKLIRTGETHAVPLPPNFSARVDNWFPDGAHLLVSREEQPGRASLWSISVFGGSPRQLAEDGSGGSLSPDGTHIAFRRVDLTYDGLLGREVWIMRSDGTDQVKVAAATSDGSQVGAPTWSPDGKRIAYIRSKWAYNARTNSVEVNEWQTARVETLFSESRLTPALHWLPDDRLIYALGNQQASSRQDSTLWMVSLQQSRKISGPPKRIAQGHGLIVQIAGSADGKVLTFRSENWSASAYIGTLAADGTRLLAKTRLTLDESVSIPVSWTPDSKGVLFSSDRNGTPEIFKQASDQRVAESLMSSAEQLSQPRVTPDGSEILYISTPKSPGPETPSSIFAIPIGGGTPRLVLKDVRIWNVQCARLPSTICLYSIMKGNTSETFRFDVRSGKSADPPQIDPSCNWALSRDGSRRAIIAYRFDQGTIQLRSTSTGKSRDLIVKGWNGLMGIDWSADGRSLLVSWHKHDLDSALLNVTLAGRASVLLRSSNDIWHAVPSPDGRFLAIAEASGTKNVWQLENF
jgi:Tol biopolymer transport system component/DNA-binding winged helix-turn-helix (wHTH) protein